MLRHPKPASVSAERLAAFHEELKRTPRRWRACPLVRIEPIGRRCREVRRCPNCDAELVRPLQRVVTYYADQAGAAILPTASAVLPIAVGTPLAEIQQEVILQVYALVGSVKTTAQMLGVSRRALYYWCPQLSLHDEEGDEDAQRAAPRLRRLRR